MSSPSVLSVLMLRDHRWVCPAPKAVRGTLAEYQRKLERTRLLSMVVVSWTEWAVELGFCTKVAAPTGEV